MMAKKENKSKNTGADSGQLVAGGNRKIDPSAGAQNYRRRVACLGLYKSGIVVAYKC